MGAGLWRSAGRRSAAARAPVAIVERGARRVGLFSSMTAAGVASPSTIVDASGEHGQILRGRATADRSTGRGCGVECLERCVGRAGPATRCSR